MTLTCRWLNEEDLSQWRVLRREALRMEPDAFLITLAEFEAKPDDQIRAQLAQGALVGAWQGEVLLGAMAFLRKGQPATRHRASLAAVYVRASAQGRGIARLLMTEIEARAAREGVVQLELDVWAGNARAIEFYKRNGFEIVGRTPRAVMTDGEARDDLFMVRALDQ